MPNSKNKIISHRVHDHLHELYGKLPEDMRAEITDRIEAETCRQVWIDLYDRLNLRRKIVDDENIKEK